MKFYFHPLSTYSQKTLIALYETGVAFEPELVNLFDPAARSAYLQVYPLGKIPLLVRDDGHRIPESSTIIEYLDSISRNRRLLPAGLEEARQTRFHDRMFDLYLNDSVVPMVFESWKPEAERNRALIEKRQFYIDVLYSLMEQRFAEREWTMGSEFTLADCAAAPPLFYAQQVAPFADRTHVTAYWQRLAARPSVRRVLDEAKPHLDAMQAG